MTTTEEHTLTLADGLEVYTKTWEAVGPPVAHVLFLHGFSDHCNAYYGFPAALAAAGIEFFSFDQRGAPLPLPQHDCRPSTGRCGCADGAGRLGPHGT